MPDFHIAKQNPVFPFTPKSKSKAPVSKGSGKRPGRHWQGPEPHGKTYQAGEIVRQSGIYEAIHEGAHRGPHDVVMIEADLFPSCDTCSNRVRFRLIRTAPYIFTDEDFEKPK